MATACGKVILLGEHAVVYGVPAIVAGLPRGASARAEAAERDTLWLGERQVDASDDDEVARAFRALLERLDVRGVQVRSELQIPSGMGLGASAALGVAIARAALDHAFRDRPHERPDPCGELVREAASAWERVFHGNPSGIDAAAATFGGCFRFDRTSGVKPLQVKQTLPLAVALSGQPASTKQMVQQVAAFKQRRPEVFEKTLAGIGSLVENAALCIQAADLFGLGKLLDLTHVLLSGLFLSTPQLETACSLARDAGALGAKLTGSGGGGAVIALTRMDERDAVLQAWRHSGIECFAADVPASTGGGR